LDDREHVIDRATHVLQCFAGLPMLQAVSGWLNNYDLEAVLSKYKEFA
jgi:hypothetical protein